MTAQPVEVRRLEGRRSEYRCQCGNVFTALRYNVANGNTASCGCARVRHGLAGSPIYSAWQNMRQRVTDHDRYPTYVNVQCDERWLTFDGFLANQPAGRPFEPGLCLSRVGDEGDYTPENARWLTRTENSQEQRRSEPKTHCRNGHEYTPENTKVGADGRYRCRTCAQERSRAYRAKVSS